MSEAILCPVCDTSNAPDAINCEVCGERLAPIAPGEEVPPEQLMAQQLAEQPLAIPSAGFAMDEDDDLARAPSREDLGAPEESPTADIAHLDATPQSEPAVLYSHMTGDAYHAGSPEYEEGFGPMGDQLFPTPPPAQSTPGLPEEAEEYSIQPMDAPISFGDTNTLHAPEPAPTPKKESAFQVSGPNASVTLPSPGPHEQHAELTLYFQKQPVLRHAIDTDEVLIGRKDIRADIDPDIDLTTWDHDAYVSRKHAYIYRQNKNYTLYAVSNSGLQLNNDLLELGDRRELNDGDIIVIAGILAMKFSLPT